MTRKLFPSVQTNKQPRGPEMKKKIPGQSATSAMFRQSFTPLSLRDPLREEKLAAARKKLKQFQKKKTPSNSPAGGKPPKAKRQTTVIDKSKQNDNSSAESSKEVTPEPEPSVSPNASNVSSPVSTYSTPMASTQGPSASTEGLQQLSRQINGLLEQSSAFMNGEDTSMDSAVADLEARNRELAALLEKHSQSNHQLTAQVQDLKNQSTSLQNQLDSERGTFEDRQKRELGALKEQLQVHIQTIGILVAEKTELQASLNQSQKNAEQRLAEIDELSGRLKASRQRVAELERDFASANTTRQEFEKNSKEYSKDVDRLKLDLYKANKNSDELKQQNSELQEKLHAKSSECAGLEQSVVELKGKLELAEVYVQQLSNQDSKNDTAPLVEQLTQEKIEMQTRLQQYAESFQKLTTERDQMAEQYKQYIDQLNRQQQDLVLQITGLNEEKERLLGKQQELEVALATAQEKIKDETLDKPTEVSVDKSLSTEEVEKISQQYQEQINQLRQEYEIVAQNYQAQVSDNQQLSRLVGEKEERLLELESTVARLGEETIDKDQVLESMQSDKTALSRAMTQNKDLKIQLEELQNGFVKMSNDNMELMSSLQSEQHVAKELATRLSQQEDELKDLREHLSQKEQELETMRLASETMKKEIFQHEQIEDRMRHYDAQAPLVETLQKDLSTAQDAINALTAQNSDLRTMLAKAEDKGRELQDQSVDGFKKDEVVASLSASVQQLEMERNQLLQTYEEEQEKHYQANKKVHELEAVGEQLRKEIENQKPAIVDGEVVGKEAYESLATTLEKLKEKYTQAMNDKAELSDRVEQLEHLTMQLQGETETIGEYISLYQSQRQALKHRQREKDNYIARLAWEREEMQGKLGQLQALVMQLMQERNILHSYHTQATPQQQQQLFNNNNTKPPMLNNLPSGDHHHSHKKKIGGTLDSTQLDDWPDYTSESSGDSDDSAVEAIVGGAEPSQKTVHNTDSPNLAAETPPEPPQDKKWNIPPEDQTAQKIMHLLTEIGNTNLVENVPFSERNFLPCTHCTGRLISV